MDVVLRTSYGEAEITLRDATNDATLADVVKYVTGQNSPPIVFVDDRALPATTMLDASGLLCGSTIATNEPHQLADDGAVELVQIAGRGSGTSASLSAGHYVLGPGRRASAHELNLAPVDHPSFEVIVASDSGVDVRARTGSIRLDGVVVDVGDSVQWSTETLDSGDRVFQLIRRSSASRDRRFKSRAPAGHSTVAFTRPHRRAPLLAVDPITSSEKHAISGHHGAERDRQRSAQPHVGDLVTMARDTDPRLWERRPGDVDVFHVPIGLVDIAWSPQLHTHRDDRDDARRVIEECGPLPMVPVPVDLAAETGIALIGEREFTTDLARALMLSAAVTHGPADLDIVVITDPEQGHAWEWSKWLPHTRSGTEPRLLSTEPDIRSWVRAIQGESANQGSERSAANHLTFVIVDDVDLWRDRNSVLRPLFSDTPSSVHLLVLADGTAGAPGICPILVRQEADLSTSIEFLPEGRRVHGVRPFLASVDIATEVALALAPLDDPELSLHGSDVLPASVRLPDLLRLDQIGAGAFLDRWSKTDSNPSAFVGMSSEGPVDISLVNDGPNGLIVGAGANQLAQLFVAGLCANEPPSALNIVLIDLTDKATIGGLSELPHTVWADSEPDEQQLRRVLKCLQGELNRRIAGGAESNLPHLVLVVLIDGTATNSPDFLDEIVLIAQSGREVGFHLLVAIEHQASPINNTIVDTFDFRIALRTTEDESLAVLGTSIASLLPSDLAGRAYALLPESDGLILLQAAQPDRTLDIHPFVKGRELSPMEHRLIRTSGPTAAQPEARSTLSPMAAAMNRAVTEHHFPRPRPLCPDPLPNRLTLRSFFDDHPGDGVPFALVDLPDEQRLETEWWQPDLVGGLLIVGGKGSGKTALLKSLALGIGERYSADEVHLYCFDASGSELDLLGGLAHTGVVVGPGENAARLSRSLKLEFERRSALVADNETQMSVEADPTIVVMVDDLSDFDDFTSTAEEILAHGRSVKMHVVITTSGGGGPGAAHTATKVSRVELIYRNSETPTGSQTPSGRARRSDGSEMQLVVPPSDLAGAIRDVGAEAPHRLPQLGEHG